jgi:hypothetical protein
MRGRGKEAQRRATEARNVVFSLYCKVFYIDV